MLQVDIIPVTPFSQNCSLIWDDQTHLAVLIDAGGDIEKLEAKLKEHQLTLTALWNTHAHLDHMGAVGTLAARYQIPVIGPHPDDQFWLDGLIMQASMFGFPTPDPINVTQWLFDGDTLQLGEYKFNVYHTPGHTPGHVVLYCAQMNLLWTGDVLFQGSIGRTDFPRGDYATLIHSIQDKILTLPDDTQFICGHGPMSTIGAERKQNPYLQQLC